MLSSICPIHYIVNYDQKIIQNNTTVELRVTNPYTQPLTPWNSILLEKLTVTHVSKKIPIFYEIRRSVIVFTSACHRLWTKPAQFTILQSISSRTIWILSYFLCPLPPKFSLQIFRPKLCKHFKCSQCVLHVPAIPFASTSLPKQYVVKCTKMWNSTSRNGPYIQLSALFLNPVSIRMKGSLVLVSRKRVKFEYFHTGDSNAKHSELNCSNHSPYLIPS